MTDLQHSSFIYTPLEMVQPNPQRSPPLHYRFDMRLLLLKPVDLRGRGSSYYRLDFSGRPARKGWLSSRNTVIIRKLLFHSARRLRVHRCFLAPSGFILFVNVGVLVWSRRNHFNHPFLSWSCRPVGMSRFCPSSTTFRTLNFVDKSCFLIPPKKAIWPSPYVFSLLTVLET